MSRKHKRDQPRQWWGSRWADLPEHSGGGRQMSHHAQSSDTFTCTVDGVSACSRAPKSDVLIDSRLWQAIVGLCERFDTEWLAYLIGERTSDGDYEVKELSFPEQSAGGAHVHTQETADSVIAPNTIGAIHSHVGMSAFFSSTDVAHANWPVEIVVNRKGEYEVSMRVTLPCGESMRVKSRVLLLTGGQLGTMEGQLKEALEKGKAKEPPKTVWPLSGSGYGSGYGFYSHDDGQRTMYGPSWQGTDEERLLGGKYLLCPICGGKAIRCPHPITAMEAHEAAQKAVHP